MRVTVESCARELRETKDRRPYTGLKINGQWINVIGDHRDKYKKEIDVEIKGNWGQIIEPPAQNPKQFDPRAAYVSSNGHKSGPIPWEQYKLVMIEAHELAQQMEPDSVDQKEEQAPVYLDRARARAAIINTVSIAFTKGEIAAPEDEGLTEADDNIPF